MLFFAGLMGLMAAGSMAMLVGLEQSESEDIDEEGLDALNDTETGIEADTSADDPPVQGDQDTESAAVGAPQDPTETTEGSRNSWGADLDDLLTGNALDNQINGYGGDDTVFGLDGDDVLHGGDGEDVLLGGEDDDLLHGEHGKDFLDGGNGEDVLYGHSGEDTLSGGGDDDTAYGGQDQDVLSGGDGNDALHGGYGNDTLIGGNGLDTLFGGQGDDVIDGFDNEGDAAQVDYLNGGDGADSLLAGQGDILTGGDGNDSFIVGDWIIDGNSADVMDFDPEEDRLLVVWDESTPPEIAIESDSEDPELTRVTLNGEEIAQLRGSGPVDMSHVVVMAAADLPDLPLSG